MPSYAHIKLDFYDDPTVVNNVEVPAFVRETPMRSKSELHKLGSDNFALVIITPDNEIHPKFPVHSPGDTWLSMLAFEKNAHKMPVVMQETAAKFINDAAASWGLSSSNEMFNKVASQNDCIKDNVVMVSNSDFEEIVSVKTASDESKANLEKLSDDWFALVVDDSRLYPLHNREMLHKAASWFEANHKDIEPKYRKDFADKLVWAAGRHSEVLDAPSVRKYANNRYSEDLEVVVQHRKNYCLDEDSLHLLDDILEKKASITPRECAQVLELVDKQLGINKYWDREIPDPYTSVFAMPKMAEYSYSDDGVEVSGGDLRSFVKSKDYREKLQAYMSKEIVDELERNPVEIFDSLPKPEKRLLVDLMKEK